MTSYYFWGLSLAPIRLKIYSQEMGTIPWVKNKILYWFHIRPWNKTFRRLFVHMRRDSSDNLPRRWLEFPIRLSKRLAVGLRTYRYRLWVNELLHKVSCFVGSELIVWPEGIIEGKISEFLLIIWVKKTGSISDHVYAKPAVEIDFSLVVGSYSYTDFNTHFWI